MHQNHSDRQHLIPALEKMLPFHFDPMEWWDLQPRTPKAVAVIRQQEYDSGRITEIGIDEMVPIVLIGFPVKGSDRQRA